MLKAMQVRLHTTTEQQFALAKSFGCARWYCNLALNVWIQHDPEVGKTLNLAAYKGMLPQLKIEHPWLTEDWRRKDFVIFHDAKKVTKDSNHNHLKHHQKNLGKKQQKLARKTQGSPSKEKLKKIDGQVVEIDRFF